MKILEVKQRSFLLFKIEPEVGDIFRTDGLDWKITNVEGGMLTAQSQGNTGYWDFQITLKEAA